MDRVNLRSELPEVAGGHRELVQGNRTRIVGEVERGRRGGGDGIGAELVEIRRVVGERHTRLGDAELRNDLAAAVQPSNGPPALSNRKKLDVGLTVIGVSLASSIDVLVGSTIA